MSILVPRATCFFDEMELVSKLPVIRDASRSALVPACALVKTDRT